MRQASPTLSAVAVAGGLFIALAALTLRPDADTPLFVGLGLAVLGLLGMTLERRRAA